MVMATGNGLVADADMRERIKKLCMEVQSYRDRFPRTGLTFVWQSQTHPMRGKLWNPKLRWPYSKWQDPIGDWLCETDLPIEKEVHERCQVFFWEYYGEPEPFAKFKQHANEIAVLLQRVGTPPGREQLVRELFERNLAAKPEFWGKNEQPGHPETYSRVIKLDDAFGATEVFLTGLLGALPEAEVLPTIISLGKGCYKIGDSRPYRMTDSEDAVLTAFLEVPAMEESELDERSGFNRSRDVLKDLETKYDGVFAAAICRPGGKGKGGYHVAIKVGDEPL
jgi:hypothetical protein